MKRSGASARSSATLACVGAQPVFNFSPRRNNYISYRSACVFSIAMIEDYLRASRWRKRSRDWTARRRQVSDRSALGSMGLAFGTVKSERAILELLDELP